MTRKIQWASLATFISLRSSENISICLLDFNVNFRIGSWCLNSICFYHISESQGMPPLPLLTQAAWSRDRVGDHTCTWQRVCPLSVTRRDHTVWDKPPTLWKPPWQVFSLPICYHCLHSSQLLQCRFCWAEYQCPQCRVAEFGPCMFLLHNHQNANSFRFTKSTETTKS